MANINIIAPLKAAGNFPVTTSDQINLNPASPEEGTVQDAISALQRQVGLSTDSSPTTISLPDKIDILAETLTEDLASKAAELRGSIDTHNINVTSKIQTLDTTTSNIDAKLSGLREYITTLMPPALTVSTNASDPYDVEEITQPTITITGKVSAPLEDPLCIKFDSSAMNKQMIKQDEYDEYTYIATWKPQYTNQDLPYTITKTVKICNENNSNVVYRSQAVSCTFAAKIYYGVSESTSQNDISSFTGRLSAGHPSSIQFEVAGDAKYCYYCYPESYGTPIIRVGGFEGGFEPQANKLDIDGRSYIVYRSNQKLKTTTTVSLS